MSIWNLIPQNDLHPHEESTTCHCGPRVEFVEGTGDMLVVHKSFDERELIEEDNA